MSLFDEEDGTPETAVAKRKDPPAVHRAIDRYIDEYRHRFGATPLKPITAREGKHLKELMRANTEATVIDFIIPEFFRSSHPRIVRSDYSITALYLYVGYLAMPSHTDDRAHSILDAMEKASRPRTKTEG